MVLLSDNQVDRIHDLLLDRGVSYDHLRADLLDHICCMVELKMEDGISFESALKTSVRGFGENGLKRTQEATIYLLTLKIRIMRKAMSYFGLAGGLTTSLAVFFKLMHWPGANMLLILGILMIVFLYLPMLIFVKLKELDSSRLKAVYVVGISGAIIHGIGWLFKIMHWPGGSALMITSLVIIGLVFLPLYYSYAYKLAENKLSSLAFATVLFAGVFMLYSITNLDKSAFMRESMALMFQNQRADLERISEEGTLAMNARPSSLQDFTAKTAELLNYIETMRTRSIALTQDLPEGKAQKLTAADLKWGRRVNDLQESLNAPGSDISAQVLKSKIESWKEAAARQGISSDTLKSWLCCQSTTVDGRELSWMEAHFGKHTTVLSLVTYLDQLALEVNQRYLQVAS